MGSRHGLFNRLVPACAAIVALLVPIVLQGLVAPALSPAYAATVPTQASLQSKATQLAETIFGQAGQIHVLAVQASDDEASALAIQAQLTSDNDAVAAAQRAIASRRKLLRNAAISAFVQQGSANGISVTLDSSQSNVSLREEYLTVATGDVTQAVGSLRDAQEAYVVRRASLVVALSLARSKVAAADAAEQALRSEVDREVTALTSVKGQLAVLVAQASAKARPVQGLPSPAGVVSVANGPASTSQWGGATPAAFAALRQCESGGNYADDTGNGYYGAYQFSLSTWEGLGYSGLPSQAPPAVQDQAAERLQAQDGWGQWPACAAELGLA